MAVPKGNNSSVAEILHWSVLRSSMGRSVVRNLWRSINPQSFRAAEGLMDHIVDATSSFMFRNLEPYF